MPDTSAATARTARQVGSVPGISKLPVHFLAPIFGKETPAADGCVPRTHPRPEPGRKRRLNSLQEVGWWGDPERGILARSQILALGPEAFLEVQLRVRELRARRRHSNQQQREVPRAPYCLVQDGTLVHANALPRLRLRRLSRRYDEKLM